MAQELVEEVDSLLEAISGAQQAVHTAGSLAAASETEPDYVSAAEVRGSAEYISSILIFHFPRLLY
jgi:hypothetical protein